MTQNKWTDCRMSIVLVDSTNYRNRCKCLPLWLKFTFTFRSNTVDSALCSVFIVLLPNRVTRKQLTPEQTNSMQKLNYRLNTTTMNMSLTLLSPENVHQKMLDFDNLDNCLPIKLLLIFQLNVWNVCVCTRWQCHKMFASTATFTGTSLNLFSDYLCFVENHFDFIEYSKINVGKKKLDEQSKRNSESSCESYCWRCSNALHWWHEHNDQIQQLKTLIIYFAFTL